MMRDPITDAAQDPSCLLCLTPDRGGSWWSRLRPAMPRDFIKGYRWDALQAAMYSSLPWTNDYHFTFDFTVADDFENGSYWIMYQSNGRIVFSLDKDARGCRFTFGSFAFSGGVYVFTPFQPSLAGRHEVTLSVAGNTLRITLAGAVYEQSGERVESSDYNRVVTTSAPVTLHAVSLTDDSTGTAVWQTAYSDLYDTSNPWPSPVPENFAEKAKAFYDCQAVVREALDPTHDYSFLIDFKLDEAKTSGNVFSISLSDAPFALIFQSNNQIDFFTNLLKPNGGSDSFTSIYAYYQSDVKLQGRHQIECKIEANMLSSYLDGVLVAQKTSNLERTGTVAVGLPNCNSGYVYKIQITDLTDNQVVWSYPSEAERVRLITKTNVRTDRGAFEAANPALGWSIKTALPAGLAGTVLAKINGEYIVNPAQWNRTTATFTGAATDTLSELAVFEQTLTYEQITYLCGVKRWVIPVSAGNINIATVGFQNLRWTFPDGSTSTAASINQTVAAGVITCEYVGLLNGQLAINNSAALASSIMRAIDLPRVTSSLTLNNLSQLTGTTADLPRVISTLQLSTLPGLTGTTADLPRVTYHLYLSNLPELTGTTADLPKVTSYLILNILPGLTGTTADLPANTGERRCYIVANVTGALSVVATNTPIYFYATGATALEYDETVHNCVVAGGTGKTLHIGTGTSAGDADIQTLRDRGWSVTIH